MQSSKVKLKFLSTMRHAINPSEGTIEVRDGATVRDLLKTISATYGEVVMGLLFEGNNATLRNDVLILVNDTDIGALDGMETTLSENDEVVLMPISHGG